MQKIFIIGHVGKNPESKFTPSGMQIVKFSLASTESTKKGDNWENETEWFNIVCFDKKAKYASDYIKKGNMIYIEGKQKTQTWQDEQGQKHYKTEIIANVIKSLTKNESNNSQTNNNPDNGDDLPF